MPLTVYVLGLSIFALGTSEFMLSGLLPPIAADLGVSVPDAGLLISAYALGMLFGAPVLAVTTRRLPRKTTLLGLLAVFAASHVVSALAPGYGLLFGSRIVAAVANAGFWAAATATTIAVVPAGRRGRAMSIVTGGLTVATVLGVPAGTFLGQQAGWRSAFWAVCALSALAFVAVVTLVPAVPGASERAGLGTELRAYRAPRLWLALGIISISTAAITVVFAYLSPLMTETMGLPAEWVPAVLALYGVGALLGITIGGRFADRHAIVTITASALLTLTASAVLATAPAIPVAVGAATLLGFAGFAANPALNARVFALAEDAPSLSGATSTSAFNVGIVIAPWVGGLTIGAGLGYLSVTWLGMALAALTLVAIAWAALLEHRREPTLATT